MKNHDHNIELYTIVKKNNKSPKCSIIIYYRNKNLIKKKKKKRENKKENKRISTSYFNNQPMSAWSLTLAISDVLYKYLQSNGNQFPGRGLS